MSPEQASGDGRSMRERTCTVWRRCCYEMLAGEPPFTGPTAQAVVAKRLAGDPPSVRRTRPTEPRGWTRQSGKRCLWSPRIGSEPPPFPQALEAASISGATAAATAGTVASAKVAAASGSGWRSLGWAF